MAGKIGGDSYLSHNGRKYANCLADFVEQIPEKNLKVFFFLFLWNLFELSSNLIFFT